MTAMDERENMGMVTPLETYRTFKFRLSETAEQRLTLERWAGVCRAVYNVALEQRMHWWRQYKSITGRAMSWQGQDKELTSLREQFDWIAECPRTCQVAALKDLDLAFKRLFSGGGFPKFRSRRDHNSMRFADGENVKIKVVNAKWAKMRLTKIGNLKFRLTRDFPPSYSISQVTVKREANHWYVCIGVRYSDEIASRLPGIVGIDRGIANTLALSTGLLLSLPKQRLDVLESKATKQQQLLSRKKRGSARRRKTREILANTRTAAARMRLHWNHEQTRAIANQFGTVVIERLAVTSMTASAKGTVEVPGSNVAAKSGLNRRILSQNWHQFESVLAYKIEARGGKLIKINPAYTSQTCSGCGTVDARNRESQAKFACVECGHEAHADVNAAINILRAGTRPAPSKVRSRGQTTAPKTRANLGTGRVNLTIPDGLSEGGKTDG